MAFHVAEMNFNEVANAAGWESTRVAKFAELQMGAERRYGRPGVRLRKGK
jgi:hypothetical protein